MKNVVLTVRVLSIKQAVEVGRQNTREISNECVIKNRYPWSIVRIQLNDNLTLTVLLKKTFRIKKNNPVHVHDHPSSRTMYENASRQKKEQRENR